MSNVTLKKERGCAQVWWKVTTTGWISVRLTTPVRSRAFFMRGTLPRKKGCHMATATLSPAEVSARRLAAVNAELTRNGIKPPRDSEPVVKPIVEQKQKPAFGESLRTARRQRAEERVIKESRPEFVSAPDAKTMRPEDIANIAALTPADARAILSRLAIVCPGALHRAMGQTGLVWGGWGENDVRWTLTPHELRKRGNNDVLAGVRVR